MNVSHNLTPRELKHMPIRKRQREANEAILRCAALRRHRAFHDKYPAVFGQLACTQPGHTFKKAVHEIYALHGLTLHEFSGVESEALAA